MGWWCSRCCCCELAAVWLCPSICCSGKRSAGWWCSRCGCCEAAVLFCIRSCTLLAAASLGSGSGCCWDAPVLLRLRVGLPGDFPRCCWVGGVVSGTVASGVSWHGFRPPVHATLLACPVSTSWATASISSCVCVLGAPKSGCSVAGACCSGCCPGVGCPRFRWLLLLVLGSGSSLAPLWGAAAVAVLHCQAR